MEKLKYKIIIIFITVLCILSGCKKNNQQENICLVTFDSCNETENYSVQVEKGNNVSEPNDPIRNGYKFLGWYYQDKYWSFIGNPVTENITLTAKWETIEYSIKYENIEDSTNPNPNFYNLEIDEIILNEPIRDGYEFLGWYYQDELYKSIDCSLLKDITLTAKWNIAEYDIYYENLYGSPNSNPSSFNIETETFTLENPVHKYYEFIGWTYEGQDTPIKNVEVSKGSLGDKVFKANWLNVRFEIIDNEYYVAGLKYSKETNLVIPNSYNGKKITGIRFNAFPNSEYLTSIEIPSNIKCIEDNALVGLYNLTSIKVDENNLYYKSIDGNLYSKDEKVLIQYAVGKTDSTFIIPNSIEKLNMGAFYGACHLTNIEIPNSVTTIDSSVFCGCVGLTSIEIPNSVISIGSFAFVGTNIVSITIPDSVTSIGQSAFKNCDKLENVIFSNSLTSITKGLFASCHSLETLIIPCNITSIEDEAFSYCSKLSNIVMPNSVLSIGYHAFYYCASLENIIIPKSVVTIKPYAFEKCYYLTIYCEAEFKPSTWDDKWNYYNNHVIWDYTDN